MAEPILSVRNLVVEYQSRRGVTRAVEDVSLDVMPGEIVGLAGESGSGKSTMALAVTRLIKRPGRITGGSALFRGQDILKMPPDALRKFRWEKVALVFQSAMNSLNPVLSIGSQFEDMFRAHGIGAAEARQRSAELLRLVRIDPHNLDSYPHELSGGMRQRAVIAMALALHPDLVIMDEPTTALDVVVERGIVAEIRRLQKEFGFSILFVTHDLALLSTIAHRIAVMYAGQLVEIGVASEVVHSARHPYSQALARSFPRVRGERRAIAGIPGSPPDMRHPPAGCRFHDRCPQAMPICRVEVPQWTTDAAGNGAACHLLGREEAGA